MIAAASGGDYHHRCCMLLIVYVDGFYDDCVDFIIYFIFGAHCMTLNTSGGAAVVSKDLNRACNAELFVLNFYILCVKI